MTANSSGNCYLCGVKLAKTAMGTHLFKLHEVGKGGQECCLLKIEGAYDKSYWLYIDIPVGKTLSEVDKFLRKIWLECCGHMSEFLDSGRNEIGMSRKLGGFSAGDKILHVYDFGDTTETIITVMGSTWREPQKNTVRLLARNVPPVFNCTDCGKAAEYTYAMYTGPSEDVYYCVECADEKEDAEMLLPVTNSPRMGVCGYDGELDTFEFKPVPRVAD